MFDHVKFGVSDYAASQAFFLKALEPRCQTEEKPAHLHVAFTAGNRQQVEAFCARTTTRTTMQLSSLVRTGTTSKWFATNPRPNRSIEGTSTSGLRQLAAAPHVELQGLPHLSSHTESR